MSQNIAPGIVSENVLGPKSVSRTVAPAGNGVEMERVARVAALMNWVSGAGFREGTRVLKFLPEFLLYVIPFPAPVFSVLDALRPHHLYAAAPLMARAQNTVYHFVEN